MKFPKDVFLSEKIKELISGMLEKAPVKRLDIKQIATKIGVKEKHLSEIPFKVETEKTEKLENIGFTQKTIAENLKKETANHIKALYELI